MRVLKFIVDGRSIKQDPICNFSGLFPGKENFIKAEFTFSTEWNDAVKVVAFWSITGSEYSPQVLDENNSCAIPKEALARPAFKMQVLGRSAQKILETNKMTIYQRGGTR